jgi:hypothetical protein
MRLASLGVVLILLSGIAVAQSSTAALSPHTDSTGTTGAVASTQPVITVRGVCQKTKGTTAPNPGACTTVIARKQFEDLMEALHPGQDLPSNARSNLAKLYAEYVVIEAATRKAGMEDTAEFREFMNWMRVLAASEYYRRKLQEKVGTPSPDEIHAFYQEHKADYEAVHLLRIVVPRENRVILNPDEFEKKAHETIEAARASLVKGLDPTEVQKNAYQALGLESPPPVDVGTRRRKDFQADEGNEVFSLQSGEISKVQTEPRNYVLYKIASRDTTSESDVTKSISSQLTEHKFREAMRSVLDSASVDLNEKYFGTPTATPSEPPVSPHSIVSH